MTTQHSMELPPGYLAPPGGWGHAGAVAIRKARIAGWTPCTWKRIGDDSLYTGGVEAIRKNGKRWHPKPHTQVVVTAAEVLHEEERYEREHSRCCNCFGRGKEWAGWGKDTGDRYRECGRCRGSGRPRQ